MPTVILASASPRRRLLLELLGIPFEVEVSSFIEVIDDAVPADQLVCNLAYGKAADVLSRRPNDVVIGADTIVVFADEYLGKPVTEDDATDQLRKMSGKDVSIFTGFVVLNGGHSVRSAVEVSARIKNMSDGEISAYVGSGVYADKAGGISIEIVERFDGDLDAVLGLPLKALAQELRNFGVEVSAARD